MWIYTLWNITQLSKRYAQVICCNVDADRRDYVRGKKPEEERNTGCCGLDVNIEKVNKGSGKETLKPTLES